MKRSFGQLFRKAFGVHLGVFHQHDPVPLSALNFQNEIPSQPGLPGIAVVTPSFNQAAFVARTVNSVVTQDFCSAEYIVQDAMSTDGTSNILKRISGAFNVFYEEDDGQADALNRGFSKTKAPIMAWLNSDDVLLPGALRRVAATFAAHPEIDVLYGDRLIIDECDNVIGAWVLPYHDETVMRIVDYIPQETLFWRRSAWERAGGYIDVNFDFALDWEFILRLAKSGCRFTHLPCFLGGFRYHPAQKTLTEYEAIGRAEIFKLRKVYGDGNFVVNTAAHMKFLAAHRTAHSLAWAALSKKVEL